MGNHNPDAFYYKNMKLSKKKVAIAIAALVAIIFAIIYLLFSVYFQSHFLLGTTINGIDCSGKSVSEVEKLINKDTRYYVLKLIERDNVVEHISAEDINLSLNLQTSVASIKDNQNPYSWLFSRDNEITIPTSVTYDEAMLMSRIDTLSCTDTDKMRKPSSSSLIYEDGVYTVKKGDAGTELDVEKLKSLIIQAVNNRADSINLETTGCYLVTATDETSKLLSLEETLNKYLLTTINLQFGDDTETIDKTLISQWISLNESNEVVFDTDAILNYLTSLAKKYETFGSSREFLNSYGNTVIVKGGDYGWWFNKTEEVNNIINDIKNFNSCTRTIAYRQEAAEHGDIDIGDTYCEISLSKQKLFLYVKGEKLLEADIISGTKNTKHATPTGTYRLRYKQKTYTFKRTYFNRTVNYWMVFYGSSADDTIGLLAADWLTEFGGSVYKTNGSYGSIYLSKADAYTVYKNLPNDSAIVIYD